MTPTAAATATAAAAIATEATEPAAAAAAATRRRRRRLGHVLGLVDDLATGDDAEFRRHPRNPHGPPLARRR